MSISSELISKEYEFGATNYKPMPVVLSRGKGAKVWDVEGKEYYDFLSAYSAVNQGHCHPKIVAALKNQVDNLCLTSRAFHNDQLPICQEFICKTFGYEKVLLMNSGAEGMESAVKIARKWAYTKKGIAKNEAVILVAERNFHGRTVGAISASTDSKAEEYFGPLVPGFQKIPFGALEAVEDGLRNANVCAVMVEPIQGEAGIYIPEEGYLKGIQSLCKKHNVLFIADEVQTGLGRTGKLLTCHYEQVKPDILILGKALSGGFYPVSAILADTEVMGVLKPGDHGSTFGGNPLASAVAMAALKVILEEDLPQKSYASGQIFRQEMQDLVAHSPLIEKVRGKGLLNALVINEIQGASTGMDFCMALKDNGLLAKPTRRNIIRFAPPLVISENQLREACSIIKKTAQEFYRGERI